MKVIIDIPGGFGNQLFGYAFGYALSKELGCEYYIHTPFQDSGITWELQLNKLNIEYDGQLTYSWKQTLPERAIGNKLRRRFAIGVGTQICRENKAWSLADYVHATKKNTIYYGNWEHEQFFVKYRDDIVRMFTPKASYGKKAANYCKSMQMENSVGIHVRRGDKVAIGRILEKEYYLNAIQKMKDILGENVSFYVISDDISWCKENIVMEDTEFIYPADEIGNSVLDDWLILKNCEHHIVGDSTFSWWAAWLSEKPSQNVICPERMTYKLDTWLAM